MARTLPELRATVVAGAANNQLETEGVQDEELRKMNVLYCPDYVINGGGIISIESEIYKEELDDDARRAKVVRIGETLSHIFERADREGRATGLVANEMAEEIIHKAAEAKLASAAE